MKAFFADIHVQAICWAVGGIGLFILLFVLLLDKTEAQTTYTEITTGTFDPLPAPIEPFQPNLDPALSIGIRGNQLPPIQPYDDILIQTAPGQIQSEDGYRIWITDSPPTAQ